MSRRRDPELAIRDRQIYQLYVKDKWTLEALAEKYSITKSAIRNICIMERTKEENI